MTEWEHDGWNYQYFYQGRRDSLEGSNVLQRWKKGCLGKYWEDIAEERVPSHVRISLACFGDESGWTSHLEPLTYEEYGRPKEEDK